MQEERLKKQIFYLSLLSTPAIPVLISRPFLHLRKAGNAGRKARLPARMNPFASPTPFWRGRGKRALQHFIRYR